MKQFIFLISFKIFTTYTYYKSITICKNETRKMIKKKFKNEKRKI